MGSKLNRHIVFALAVLMVVAVLAQTTTITNRVEAQSADVGSWSGNGAMAHWNITDSRFKVQITIDAVYGQQTGDGTGKSNLIYIRVVHVSTDSEATAYLTSGVTWSLNHVHVNATLNFPLFGGYQQHPITIDWYTSEPTTPNTITWPNGSTTPTPGVWISGNGTAANATITIDNGGQFHPGSFTSDWAAVGTTAPGTTIPVTAAISPSTPSTSASPTPTLSLVAQQAIGFAVLIVIVAVVAVAALLIGRKRNKTKTS
jgi:hypothetical protein